MRLILLGLGVLFISLNQGYSQSNKDIRKDRRSERRANRTKLRSPLMVYPLYWGIQDTRTSPGIYRVFGPGVSLKSLTERPNLTFVRDFQFNLGIGTPNFESGALQYNFLLNYEMLMLRPLSDDFKIGLMAYVLNHNRLTPSLSNSSYAMEVAMGLGPVAEYARTLTVLRKESRLSLTIAVPVVSYLIRIPEFGLSFNGPSSKFAPIGSFNKVSIKLNLERLHRKSAENKINYFYRWDYYGASEFEDLHLLRVASHQVGFHLWIKKN